MKPGYLAKLIAVAMTFLAPNCYAAELNVFSSVGIRAALEEIAPKFEASTGHKLNLKFGTAASLKGEILQSAAAPDVAILTPAITSELVEKGKVATTPIINIAKSGLGLAVRKGDARPDISTESQFWRTLAMAKSIAYAEDGASGIYFIKLLQARGIDLPPSKLVAVKWGSPLELVARGRAELGIQLVSEIKANARVDLVAPFPEQIQNYTTMTASLGVSTDHAAGAKAFITYLRTLPAVTAIRNSGLDPIP